MRVDEPMRRAAEGRRKQARESDSARKEADHGEGESQVKDRGP